RKARFAGGYERCVAGEKAKADSVYISIRIFGKYRLCFAGNQTGDFVFNSEKQPAGVFEKASY
ncbi:MAG: hypothetical protein K2O76_04540, partial [Mailhella sp.]|nr:hypothetical protein [Mailhella sp.]